jgi:hypothetical protein
MKDYGADSEPHAAETIADTAKVGDQGGVVVYVRTLEALNALRAKEPLPGCRCVKSSGPPRAVECCETTRHFHKVPAMRS